MSGYTYDTGFIPGTTFLYNQNRDVVGIRSPSGFVQRLSQVLLSTAVPFIRPSNLTMNNNGAFVMAVAQTTTFNYGAYMWMQADAIFAGSVAGWYYCVMSSGAAGTVFNNVHLSGQPVIPESPTPFVSTGPGAVVQTDFPLVTTILPGGSMGPNGTIKITFLIQGGAAVTKILSAVLGVNVSIGSYSNASASSNLGTQISIRNVANQARQRFNNSSDFVSGLVGAASIDTSVDQIVGVRLRCDTPATDGVALTGITIELLPAA